jgi:hypothetical protein
VKRTQIWCDHCGRIIQDKKHEENDWPLAIDNVYDSWNLWNEAPDGDDKMLCSLECVSEIVKAMLEERVDEEHEGIEYPEGTE